MNSVRQVHGRRGSRSSCARMPTSSYQSLCLCLMPYMRDSYLHTCGFNTNDVSGEIGQSRSQQRRVRVLGTVNFELGRSIPMTESLSFASAGGALSVLLSVSEWNEEGTKLLPRMCALGGNSAVCRRPAIDTELSTFRRSARTSNVRTHEGERHSSLLTKLLPHNTPRRRRRCSRARNGSVSLRCLVSKIRSLHTVGARPTKVLRLPRAPFDQSPAVTSVECGRSRFSDHEKSHRSPWKSWQSIHHFGKSYGSRGNDSTELRDA